MGISFKGGFSGGKNWNSARRYLVTYDATPQLLVQTYGDLGEVNMADGDTLVDFVTWAVENYPSDKCVLILSDHGMGWPGGWSDPAPSTRDAGSAPLITAFQRDSIFLNELEAALAKIQSNTGIEKAGPLSGWTPA